MPLLLFTLQKFQDIEESHILHMKDIIQSYSQSVEDTHVQIGEVSACPCVRHSCGWSGCLTDLKLCLPGSLCVTSISVIFDLSNRLKENQEVTRSSFYTK